MICTYKTRVTLQIVVNFFTVFIPHVYGSLWRWKHWSVQQIKPAELAFGRTL